MKKMLRISTVLAILPIIFCSVIIPEEKKEIIKPPKKGYVTLTKEEYQNLLKLLEPKKSDLIKPPKDYAVTMADYEITLDPALRISGSVIYELESLRDDEWIEAPLQDNSLGISFNRPPDGILLKYNELNVFFGTNRKSSFRLSAKVNPELIKEELNRHSFTIYSSYAVINRYTIRWKTGSLKLHDNPLTIISKTEDGSYTTLKGLTTPNNELTFRFEAVRTESTEAAAEKRVEAEAEALYNIDSGLIRSSLHYKYKTNRGWFKTLELKIPSGIDINSVNAKGLMNWDIKEEGKERTLMVEIDTSGSNEADLYVSAETSYEGKILKLSLPILMPIGTDRVKGSIGISVSDETETLTDSLEGVQEMDISDLPSEISSAVGTKPVLAYKYTWDKGSSLPKLILSLKAYERIAVLAANIESADFTTFYTDKGKALLRVRYNIRNNIKQNLKITPPKGYTLWSSFIDEDAVKPIIDVEGSLLIPLRKSSDPSSSVFFTLTLTFYFEEKPMGEEGKLYLEIPSCDLQVMKMVWEILLPTNYEYDDWSGAYQQASYNDYQAIITQTGTVKSAKTEVRFSERNALQNLYTMNEAQQQQMVEQTDRLIQQFQKKESFARLRSGMLPVKFEIPRAGIQFLFKKLILIGTPPVLTVEYELDD